MKKVCKEIIQWGVALFAAVLLVSCICFLYYRQTGWIERSANATSAIWQPNTYLVNMVEGAGIVAVDERGYTNPGNAQLSDELILCMGASYTQAKEVMEPYRYTTVLNGLLTSEEELKVYNLSRDAMFFPEMVCGVEAALEEFPQTEVLVLETGNLDFSVEQLKSATTQREYLEEQTGEKIAAALPGSTKIKNFVKSYFPILGVLKYQMSLMKTEASSENNKKLDEAEYKEALERIFASLRKIYDGRIIILYHPMVELRGNGDMEIKTSAMRNVFEESCIEYGISFVDIGNDFLEDYRQNHHVPYGFYNTTLGVGHINKWGHEIIANALYEEITGGKR